MSDQKTNNGKKGGLLKGKPHYDKNGKPVGGIKAIVTDSGKQVELEGGEVIINKHAAKLHWQELSKINQSAGGGVPIKNPNSGASDEDPQEYKEGGVITFNINKIPKAHIYRYAKNIKENYPKIWDKAGNIFGNEAFNNLEKVIKRGYWLDSEEWMFIKWRSYVARHKQDFRIEGVIAMLKWVDQVDKGWSYMKDLIDAEIKKQKESKKLSKGGQLKVGTDIEKEHAKTIKKITNKKIPVTKAAEMIAKDHLKENPNYYKIIQKLHLKKGGNILLKIAKENKGSDLENIVNDNKNVNAKYHQKYSTKNGENINIVIFENLSDSNVFYVGAFNNQGKQLAYTIIEKSKKYFHPVLSEVDKDHQRQGLMSALLDAFDTEVGQVVPSNNISEYERKMWLKRKPSIFTEIDIDSNPDDNLFAEGGNIEPDLTTNTNRVFWQMTKDEFCDYAKANNLKLELKSSNRILTCEKYYDIAIISPLISENRSNNPLLLALKTNQLSPERVQKILDSSPLLSEDSSSKQVQAIWKQLRSLSIEFWKVPMDVWLSSDYYKNNFTKPKAVEAYKAFIIKAIVHNNAEIITKIQSRQIVLQDLLNRITEAELFRIENPKFFENLDSIKAIDSKYSVKYKLKYLLDLINSSIDIEVEKNSSGEVYNFIKKQIENPSTGLGHYVKTWENRNPKIDVDRVIKTAINIAKLDIKDLMTDNLPVYEAIIYEASYNDNFSDLRETISKGGIAMNYENIERMHQVGVKLPKDIESLYMIFKNKDAWVSVGDIVKDQYELEYLVVRLDPNDKKLIRIAPKYSNNPYDQKWVSIYNYVIKTPNLEGEKNSTEIDAPKSLVTDFVNEMIILQTNKTPLNKTQVEKIALKYGIRRPNDVKELTELSIVQFARFVAHKSELTLKERYNEIVDIYKNQVNLSHRTSESILLQQYSTPAPIGFVMGLFCGFNKGGNFFEPSAGNGLLTIAGWTKDFIVNEIDNLRNSNLQLQGYKEVLKLDGSDANLFKQYNEYFDAVITNPPFGKMDAVDVDGFEITSLEQYMAIIALSCMKPDGKCAIIIGGHNEYDEKGRIKAGKNRVFFTWLYSKYDVVDVINISGRHLYSRQGTAFNTRIILVDGEAKEKKFPPLVPTSTPSNEIMSKTPVDSFDILWERIHKSM